MTFDLPALAAAHALSDERYREFLRVPALSVGLYRLVAGSVDPQRPHTEDELYYGLSGRALLRVGADDHPVAAGTLVYVPAGAEHRFHAIEEDLTVLVLFAPAEATLPPAESNQT